jgi:hypothetical protein
VDKIERRRCKQLLTGTKTTATNQCHCSNQPEKLITHSHTLWSQCL